MKIKSYRYINIVEIPEEDKYNLIPFINKIIAFIDDHNNFADYKSDQIDKRDILKQCKFEYKLNSLFVILCYEEYNGKHYYKKSVEFYHPIKESEYEKCRNEFRNRLKEYSLKQYWHDEIEEDSLDI